jgi:CheY-like chemotaxis protein
MMTEQRTARILVVDDEDTIRRTLAALLQRRGYAVTVVASGAEARALIEQQAFDLLLLDLIMPGLSTAYHKCDPSFCSSCSTV